jgi:hypothetical protein
LVLFGEEVCKTPQEFKAWSQNLGHEKVLTTFCSYGTVANHRQGEILASIHSRQAGRERTSRGVPDSETIRRVLDHLQMRAGMGDPN